MKTKMIQNKRIKRKKMIDYTQMTEDKKEKRVSRHTRPHSQSTRKKISESQRERFRRIRHKLKLCEDLLYDKKEEGGRRNIEDELKQHLLDVKERISRNYDKIMNDLIHACSLQSELNGFRSQRLKPIFDDDVVKEITSNTIKRVLKDESRKDEKEEENEQ